MKCALCGDPGWKGEWHAPLKGPIRKRKAKWVRTTLFDKATGKTGKIVARGFRYQPIYTLDDGITQWNAKQSDCIEAND